LRIEALSWIAPLWRPLLDRLATVVAVEWQAPPAADTSWFTGRVTRTEARDAAATADVVSCADPHHEAVEALRWVRGLLAAGSARPNEIAITAAAPDAWDEHILALAADTGLRIHFSHGVPALSTRDGQRCAALADILLRGLSEARVRRLLSLCAGQGTALDQLPANWLAALPRGATLLTLDDWQRALKGMVLAGQPFDAGTVLQPLLSLFVKGPGAAQELVCTTLVGDEPSVDGFPECNVNGPLCFPVNQGQSVDFGNIAQAGELCHGLLGGGGESLQLLDHEVHHVVGVALGADAIDVPLPGWRD
jgi:hypothetical protein